MRRFARIPCQLVLVVKLIAVLNAPIGADAGEARAG